MVDIPVFDGHNDTLTRIRHEPRASRRSFLERSDEGHIDLVRAREGGLAGGFFAIFTTSRNWERLVSPLLAEDGSEVPGGTSVSLPPKLAHRTALRFTVAVMSDLFQLERDSGGGLTVVKTADQLDKCIAQGTFGAILHIEGAEAIDSGLESLYVFYAAGLRSLGPVWSRPNAFASGVPFDFPRTPDIGPGLTAAGRRLVKACNELGVLLDLSHLNEKGFWDVARLSDAPLVATHSNAHAISPSPRNLTDAQLDEVARTDGVVGLNFHVGFLRADGDFEAAAKTSMSEIVRHARYISDRIGPRHVALGSDFDGATMPYDLPDATALPKLLHLLRGDGFSESEVRAIASDNWRRVVRSTWCDDRVK
jgi:membrane dipeptidase